jgi:hypothetical protein
MPLWKESPEEIHKDMMNEASNLRSVPKILDLTKITVLYT